MINNVINNDIGIFDFAQQINITKETLGKNSSIILKIEALFCYYFLFNSQKWTLND
jgi:hypothetical protein